MGEHVRRPRDGAATGGDELPDEVVEDLLSTDRSRAMLAALAAADEPLAVSDLARAVAARESDCRPDDVDDERVTRLRTALYDRHLPKLTATEVVRYDSLLGTVELGTDDPRLLDPLEPQPGIVDAG